MDAGASDVSSERSKRSPLELGAAPGPHGAAGLEAMQRRILFGQAPAAPARRWILAMIGGTRVAIAGHQVHKVLPSTGLLRVGHRITHGAGVVGVVAFAGTMLTAVDGGSLMGLPTVSITASSRLLVPVDHNVVGLVLLVEAVRGSLQADELAGARLLDLDRALRAMGHPQCGATGDRPALSSTGSEG